MKKTHFNSVPPEVQAEIDALAASKAPVRTDLIPEGSGDWSQAKRGVFYQPEQKQITLQLDADLVDWFKANHAPDEAYQTKINNALREYVSQQLASAIN
ncbi:MAG: BrnA antitoxin family protein [Cyanobacteria bacterium J06581_3]